MIFFKEIINHLRRFSFQRPLWDYSLVQEFYGNIIRGKRLQLLKKSLKNKLYLDVGCGLNLHKNFITLDYQWRPGLDLCWDITKGIPLEDNSLLGIFTEHCLEYVTYSDAYNVLLDCLRILKPGGTLRIILPDAELYLDIYQKWKRGENISFPYGVTTSTITLDGKKMPMMEVTRVMGGEGWILSAYDFYTLETMLKKVGFVDIRRESFRHGRDSVLLIDTEWRACESLYVEASKPK